MQALKAHVVNGQIVLDEPIELPEGATVLVQLYDPEGDSLSDQERAQLHRELERAMDQANAGQLIDSEEVLQQLEQTHR